MARSIHGRGTGRGAHLIGKVSNVVLIPSFTVWSPFGGSRWTQLENGMFKRDVVDVFVKEREGSDMPQETKGSGVPECSVCGRPATVFDSAVNLCGDCATDVLSAATAGARLKPLVVCLCGSTRFKGAFEAATREETLAGRVVLSVGFYGHWGEIFTDEQKIKLDELHKRKIDMADRVIVVSDEFGYFGDSTRSEIAYAQANGKPVEYRRYALCSSKCCGRRIPAQV